jgi:hypothetical protein
MAGSTLSSRRLLQQFLAETNAAASVAASLSRMPEGVVDPRTAFWIALGQVARRQQGRGRTPTAGR